MFGDLFKSVGSLVSDVTDIIVAPAVIAVEVTGAIIKPIAEVTNELVEDVKDTLR